MSAIVDSSETLERARKLHETGLHPSLIFFSKELFDSQISRCMQKLHGDNIKVEDRGSKHLQQVRTINDALVELEPRLSLLFSPVSTYQVDKLPGCIVVPALSFTVHDLCEFVKKSEKMAEARKFAQKYIDSQRSWETALDNLKSIIPSIKVARKNQKDWDIDKFTMSTLKLTKYLQADNRQFNKVEIFDNMINQSHSKQLIFGSSTKQGGKYKIYKDLSIEIPFNFDEAVLDEFFQQIYFEEEIFKR